MNSETNPLSFIVVGGSGDLARKKIYPALFALYCQGHLPDTFNVFGFARSSFSHDEFRCKIEEHLTCRYTPDHSCAQKMDKFLKHCFYASGQYNSSDSFLDLFSLMQEVEKTRKSNRLFYLAIPPSIFIDAARAIGNAGFVICGEKEPWSRVVIEKPFGRDRKSSDILTKELASVFTEDQTYRIDHYLGKDAVQNLMILRFANIVFEPVWNNKYIDSVCINWKEDIGVPGRAGYFDNFGIIRDVIQNHMLQILALIAMEKPASANAHDIRNEKVRVLKSIKPLSLNNITIGQYTAGEYKGVKHTSYKDEDSVPADSTTPTYASAILNIDNERWRGVPFIISAGKAMNTRINEVRINFKEVSSSIFCDSSSCPPANQFVVQIQPNESLYLKIINKKPGLVPKLIETNLDLKYESAFNIEIPDAYESLILDVIKGEKGLFIRSDELAAAWDIFTPVLHKMEKEKTQPEGYQFGSEGVPAQ